jgi:diguanylate cyclase (GGDEF)-like protein
VLQGIGDALRAYARRSDIVARYGGEEFALLLTNTTLEAGLFVAERLRSSIEGRNFEVHGEVVNLTASFGLTCTEDFEGERTPESLIRAADRALYASKDAGRNCVHIHGRTSVISADEFEAQRAADD